MTISKLARQLKLTPSFLEEKLTELFLAQRLRLIESEIASIARKYGISTVSELDEKIASGKLSEEVVGEDLFKLDHLVTQKKELETNKDLQLWQTIAESTALPQWNLGI